MPEASQACCRAVALTRHTPERVDVFQLPQSKRGADMVADGAHVQ